MRQRIRLGLVLLLVVGGLLPGAWGQSSSDSAAPFSLVVMDPLAAPLSCPCVEGYAQRDYEKLGEYLADKLGRPVKVTFAESLARALAKEDCDHADLVIGKDSVVRSDGSKALYLMHAVARLTDQQGEATQTGLIVVRSADSARKTEDLSGYRILFGPADCAEKFAAARKLLESAGVKVVSKQQAEVSAACSDGACKIIEWGDTQQAAAVISSYAAPLLEGCGTIKKGDLRVVGETAPVPFITAFVNGRVPEKQRKVVRQALLSAADHPELLVALESMRGFIDLDKEYLNTYSPIEIPVIPYPVNRKKTTSWPDFLGPNRNGRVAWLPDTLPTESQVVWRQSLLFPGMGGVAATQDYVIIGDRDPTNNLDAWRCYTADTGEEVWTVEYPAIGQLDYDNLPRATPVIKGNRAYLLGAFGDLVCVELDTGIIVWQTNLRVRFGASGELIWGTSATPLLVDGRLIVNPGAPQASLVALDPATGAVLWTTPGEAHAYASPILATLGGVEQIITYDKTSLGGWNPTTGQRLWTLTPPTPGDFNVPTPVVVDDKLLIVSENNGARLHAFDDAGRIKLEPDAVYSKLRPDMSTPVVTAGRVFCVKEKLFCLNAKDLKLTWVDGRRSFQKYAPLLATRDRLLAVASGGELLLIDPHADDYTVVSRTTPFPDAPSSQLYGCPALVGDRLFLRGEDQLVCLLLSD